MVRSFANVSKNFCKIKCTAIRVILIAALAVFARSAAAHDYWFETDHFFTPENSSLALHLQVGSTLVIEEERPFQAKRTVSFNLYAAQNVFDLSRISADGAVPVAEFSVGRAGTYLVGMERNSTDIVLEAQKFNDYLREEGLTEIIKERAARRENEKFGYERYSRYVKTLIQVGDKKDETYGRILGYKLEIVPLENPYGKKRGDQIKFRVLFNGAPLKSSQIFAYNRPDKEIFTHRMQTDEKGECRLKIDRTGFWLVRLVKMERCRSNCDEIDWESYWGALSFAVR